MYSLPEAEPGYVLAGKYRIEKVLGVGGMGVVVAARHLRLDECVAIKFLAPDAMTNTEAVARFEREARAAAKIKNEHVVRVMDVATLDNGTPYLVMEYLEGEDLAAWLAQGRLLTIEMTVEFVLQACEAVAAAHAVGIVHRDLKPANLFCARAPDGSRSIKVLDFGISKAWRLDTDSAMQLRMTRTGAVMGSPIYMSPEQMVAAKDVDPRTDQWSIGVILFELLTGSPPFSGATMPEICVRIASHPPNTLRPRRPDIPPELEAIVLRCLEKDRKDRFADVAELAAALAPFAPKHGQASAERTARALTASDRSPPASPPAAVTVVSSGTWGQTTPPLAKARSRTVLRVVSVAAGVLVLAFVGFWAKQRWLPSAPRAATSPAGVTATSAPPPGSLILEIVPGPVFATPSAESADDAAAMQTSSSAPTPPGTRNTQSASSLVSAKPQPAKRVSCDPPYVIDEAGHRQYKVECLK